MLSRIEACIIWAADHGYILAKHAAKEYEIVFKRKFMGDQPYFYYFEDVIVQDKIAFRIEISDGIVEEVYNPFNIKYEILDETNESNNQHS